MAQYKSSKKGPIKIDVVLWPLYPQGDILHLQTLDGPKKIPEVAQKDWCNYMVTAYSANSDLGTVNIEF